MYEQHPGSFFSFRFILHLISILKLETPRVVDQAVAKNTLSTKNTCTDSGANYTKIKGETRIKKKKRVPKTTHPLAGVRTTMSKKRGQGDREYVRSERKEETVKQKSHKGGEKVIDFCSSTVYR